MATATATPGAASLVAVGTGLVAPAGHQCPAAQGPEVAPAAAAAAPVSTALRPASPQKDPAGQGAATPPLHKEPRLQRLAPVAELGFSWVAPPLGFA